MSGEQERDEILEACCRDRQAAQVVFESQGVVLRGAFQWREGDRLVLRIWGDEPETAPELPAACCVTFVRGVRTFAFITRADALRRDEGHANLELAVPELVAAAEARRHPRISVPPEAPLEVEITGPDEVARKSLGVDVSFGGIRLELIEGPEGTEEVLSPGEPISVRLGLQDLRLDLEGRIAHRVQGHVGVQLPEAAEPQMRGLVRRIEDGWLGRGG